MWIPWNFTSTRLLAGPIMALSQYHFSFSPSPSFFYLGQPVYSCSPSPCTSPLCFTFHPPSCHPKAHNFLRSSVQGDPYMSLLGVSFLPSFLRSWIICWLSFVLQLMSQYPFMSESPLCLFFWVWFTLLTMVVF